MDAGLRRHDEWEKRLAARHRKTPPDLSGGALFSRPLAAGAVGAPGAYWALSATVAAVTLTTRQAVPSLRRPLQAVSASACVRPMRRERYMVAPLWVFDSSTRMCASTSPRYSRWALVAASLAGAYLRKAPTCTPQPPSGGTAAFEPSPVSPVSTSPSPVVLAVSAAVMAVSGMFAASTMALVSV